MYQKSHQKSQNSQTEYSFYITAMPVIAWFFESASQIPKNKNRPPRSNSAAGGKPLKGRQPSWQADLAQSMNSLLPTANKAGRQSEQAHCTQSKRGRFWNRSQAHVVKIEVRIRICIDIQNVRAQ